MANFDALFSKYDRLVLFDTETTGLIFSRDEIIEFAAVVVEQVGGKATVVLRLCITVLIVIGFSITAKTAMSCLSIS